LADVSAFAAVRAFVLRAVFMVLASIAIVILALVVIVETILVGVFVFLPLAATALIVRGARWLGRRLHAGMKAVCTAIPQNGELH
jgi:uncharacterized membrane protein